MDCSYASLQSFRHMIFIYAVTSESSSTASSFTLYKLISENDQRTSKCSWKCPYHLSDWNCAEFSWSANSNSKMHLNVIQKQKENITFSHSHPEHVHMPSSQYLSLKKQWLTWLGIKSDSFIHVYLTIFYIMP